MIYNDFLASFWNLGVSPTVAGAVKGAPVGFKKTNTAFLTLKDPLKYQKVPKNCEKICFLHIDLVTLYIIYQC